MRRLKRAMLVLATGEILSAASGALAQASVAGPVASVATTSSGASGTEQSSQPSSKANPGTPSERASNGQPGAAGAGPGAGYTWHDKQSHRKDRKARATKVNPNLSQAKGPEFTLAKDGTTRITVQLSRKVGFRTETSGRRFAVDLEQAQVAVINDRNPLITTHFATPVADARLIPHKNGVQLVIDLRESATPQVSMKDAGAGASVLEVILPKTNRKTNAPSASVRPKGKVKNSGKARAHKEPSVAPQNGTGPRLK